MQVRLWIKCAQRSKRQIAKISPCTACVNRKLTIVSYAEPLKGPPGMRFGAVLVDASDAAESRLHGRRSLQLTTRTQTSSARELPVIIHNLSHTGLLLEAPGDALTLGEALLIELPQAGEVEAHVVWRGDRFFGCQFGKAVSRASISAALLQSQPRDQVDAVPDRTDQVEGAANDAKLYPELSFAAAVGSAVLVWLLLAVAGYFALS